MSTATVQTLQCSVCKTGHSGPLCPPEKPPCTGCHGQGREPRANDEGWECGRCNGTGDEPLAVETPAPLPAEETMTLRVALHFADHPRPYHTLQAPADTNGELYRALRVLAAAYRAAVSESVQ